MSIERIRRAHGRFIKQGAQVLFVGRPARIISSRLDMLLVRLDGETETRLAHPAKDLIYLDKEPVK